ncbi:MAG: tRNA (guanosine(37)-N1)-methyltransferase TrmD [Candidatus Coatesbacteria bacterium]|nr:tRNA (guanosine(37)-N1)-methyltransferase TrmD [Candidatus Coatesbacteria bacterium]
MLTIDIVTLHPRSVAAYLETSIPGRAEAKNLARLRARSLLDWCGGDHHLADGLPYGGGAGMILRPEPFFRAVDELKGPQSKVILTDAGGRVLDSDLAKEFSLERHLIFLCGHYKAIDERVRGLADLEVSLGDVVLSGGELAALACADAAVRLLPGVLSDAEAALTDSFEGEGLLDCPWYTRPAVFRGLEVPEVLRSGDHGAIERWRRDKALERTRRRRPDLLEDS